jgi:hypothetical protein
MFEYLLWQMLEKKFPYPEKREDERFDQWNDRCDPVYTKRRKAFERIAARLVEEACREEVA